MKIIHTADWHLGNRFHGYDRTVEHCHFLKWLSEILLQEMPDVLVIAGNVFDNANPSAVAEGLFYDFLLQATDAVPGLQIVIIGGSHDSLGTIDAPAELLKRHNIYVRGTVRRHKTYENIDFENLILPLSSRLSTEAEMVCLALPYLHPYDYPSTMSAAEGLQYYFDSMMRALDKTEFKGLPVMAVAHFYAAGAQIGENEHSEKWTLGGQQEIPTDIVGRGISYTALGHVHRYQKVDCRVSEMYYAGSPLPMSFEESDSLHGVQVVDMASDGSVDVRRVGYSPLRRLLTIPHQGWATEKEVFDAIRQLPVREKNESEDSWPYLEIRMQTKQPHSNLFVDITEALSDRSIHLCRVVRGNTDEFHRSVSSNPKTDMENLSALNIFRQLYMEKKHEELPEDLEKRFKEAETQSLGKPLDI